MIIILRGHIRSSFKNRDLYVLLKTLSLKINIEIYIHTWNIYQSNISWRQIDCDNTTVTKDAIYKYFKDISYLIKDIIIDDDKLNVIIGDTNGNISNTRCPKIAWKNYWYGQFRIIEHLKNKQIPLNTNIVNFRFDILSNSFSLNYNKICNFIFTNKNKQIKSNILISNEFTPGIDNIIIGNFDTLYKLIHNFNFNLDNIIACNKAVKCQEEYVFIENNKLFN